MYLWKASDGDVLYVGKAIRLKSRVRSYVTGEAAQSLKTRALMEQATALETIVVPDEPSALILEANLIKEHRPRFNILLRDDKSYPYVKVTLQEDFPRVFVTRRITDDGARYFGPYADVGAMRRALNVVKRLFTVRSCRYDMPREMPERACLDFYIKRCKGPCVGAQSAREYQAMIDEVVAFLAGRTDDVRRQMRARMEAASQRMEFETAGEIRDALQHLDSIEEPTVVSDVGGGDRDVIGFARDGADACVSLLLVRAGKMVARDHQMIEHADDASEADILGAYMAGGYRARTNRAREVLVPFAFPDLAAFVAAVPDVDVRVPQRGARRELLDIAEQNARHLLEESRLETLEVDERAADPVYELGRELSLQRIPRSMVCFDNSTAQGRDNVGAVVWFENGRPKRSEYRSFRVRATDTAGEPDDFASMREVVGRYFTRRVAEGKPLPDLVVIDGGKGQLNAALEALTTVGLAQLPVASLAKREEEVFLAGRSEPVRLPRRSPGLRLLQRLRDETHRRAVGFNRQRRTARTITSALLQIDGIGPARRRALLSAFGSLEGIRDAAPEAIAALPGFSGALAERVRAALAAADPTAASPDNSRRDADSDASPPDPPPREHE